MGDRTAGMRELGHQSKREAVARAICAACHENPDHQGDARGNEFRWQDYLEPADAAIAAMAGAEPDAQGKVELACSHYSLVLTEAHAQATSEALDLYARIGMGQFQVLAEQISFGVVPVGGVSQSKERMLASPAQCDKARELCDELKAVMGYSRGGSNGVGHRHNTSAVHAAWEVKKVLDQAIAVTRNPNPDFRGVSYDGLVCRYTTYPAPVVSYQKR